MLQAICFDLDGTITRPKLDFNRIRSEIGPLAGEGALLEQIGRLALAEREQALEVLCRHEREAARGAQLNDGVLELLEFIRRRRLRTAIITRNSAETTAVTLAQIGVRFDKVVTRDSGLPLKPDPAPLVHLCREWRLRPRDVLMVGDYKYDTEAGRAAGTLTCLVTNGRDADKNGADWVVRTPGEVIAVIREADRGEEVNTDEHR
jgi:HAD superfamily hydrolase (TIGR01549 family)